MVTRTGLPEPAIGLRVAGRDMSNRIALFNRGPSAPADVARPVRRLNDRAQTALQRKAIAGWNQPPVDPIFDNRVRDA